MGASYSPLISIFATIAPFADTGLSMTHLAVLDVCIQRSLGSLACVVLDILIVQHKALFQPCIIIVQIINFSLGVHAIPVSGIDQLAIIQKGAVLIPHGCPRRRVRIKLPISSFRINIGGKLVNTAQIHDREEIPARHSTFDLSPFSVILRTQIIGVVGLCVQPLLGSHLPVRIRPPAVVVPAILSDTLFTDTALAGAILAPGVPI